MSHSRLRAIRLLALLLSAALALPWAGPAYALRASSEPARVGLEEALGPATSPTGLEGSPPSSERSRSSLFRHPRLHLWLVQQAKRKLARTPQAAPLEFTVYYLGAGVGDEVASMAYSLHKHLASAKRPLHITIRAVEASAAAVAQLRRHTQGEESFQVGIVPAKVALAYNVGGRYDLDQSPPLPPEFRTLTGFSDVARAVKDLNATHRQWGPWIIPQHRRIERIPLKELATADAIVITHVGYQLEEQRPGVVKRVATLVRGALRRRLDTPSQPGMRLYTVGRDLYDLGLHDDPKLHRTHLSPYGSEMVFAWRPQRGAAGMEERPTVAPITAEYGRAHAKDLTAMDAAEPVWQEEGVWAEDRWSMDVRPSTGTRLENIFDLSFAVEDAAGAPAGYIYTTNGQPDYPVTRRYPGMFIFHLSVRQDQKGRRLGPLLLLASAKAAKDKGIGPYVTLETDAKNTHARHVYESLGFVEVGQRVDLKKPSLAFVEYAAPIDTVILRAEAQVAERYGPEQSAGTEESTLPEPLERRPLPNYEALVQRELAIVRAGRTATPSGQIYWVGANGVTHAGKSSLMATLAERLQAEGFHTVHLAEDEIGLLDSALRDGWKRSDRARWLEWENWLRWEDIGATFRQINAAAREGPRPVRLTRVYDRRTRAVRDAAEPVTVFPDTIALYDGTTILDPGRYPPGTFDRVILLETTFPESARRVAGRATALGRAADPVMETTQDMAFPFWRRYVARVHPEQRASSVYDVTDFTHPVQLVYRSEDRFEASETGMPLVDEGLATLRAGSLRARTAILEEHNGELTEDLARIQRGLYTGAPPRITLLFLNHPHVLHRWLRTVAENLSVDDTQPGDARDAFQLRWEAQRHIRLLAEYPDGREPLRERHPEIIHTMRDNLTRDYTYRGPALVREFRALTRQTLGVLAEAPVTPAAGLEEGHPHSVVDAAKAILDPTTLARRKPSDWSRLHEALILALQHEPSSPEGVEQRVWQGVRDHLHATIGQELAAAGRAVRVQDPLELLRQASRGYGRSHGVDMERKLYDLASMVVVLAEAYRVEAERGLPPAPAPLTSELPPDVYLRRYRDWLITQWRRSHYREVPAAIVAGFSAPEAPTRAPGEPVSFGLLSVLAARLTGLEPTLRSFPELAKAILEPGVEAIRLIPPAAGDPPALLIAFRKPLVDPHSGMTLPAMAMAVLNHSWPTLPALPTARLFDMTDDEFFAVMTQGLQQEQALVERDPQAIQALVFDAEDPVARQHERRAHLFRLAMDGRLIPRADYELYAPEAAERLARWLGRDAGESEVLARHVRSRVETTSQVRRYRRPPVQDDVRQRLTGQFETWHRSVAVLLQLGFPKLVGDRDGEERGGVIASHELLPLLGEEYRPLAPLLLARLPDHGWVLHAQDVRTLANRLVKFRRVLEEARPAVRTLAGSLPPLDRAVFLAQLNLGLLVALPPNPSQPFRGISTEEVQRVLTEQARAHFGDGVNRLPVVPGHRQQVRAPHEAVLRALEAEIWSSFPDHPDALERALRQMEAAAAALQALGARAVVAEPPPLRLASPQFVEDLLALQAWVTAALRESQSPSSTEPVPVSLPRYRMLVQISRQAHGGQLREALHAIGTVISQVSGEEAERLARFRRDLAARVAQATVSAILAAPLGRARDALRQHVRETRALLQEYPDLLEQVMMDEQRLAIRLLEQYREPLQEQRLLREFLQAVAEAEPVSDQLRGKLQRHFLNVAGQRSLPPLYRAVAVLDPSLLPSARHAGMEEPWVIAKKRRGSSVWFFGPVDTITAAYINELDRVNRPGHPIEWSLARLNPAFGVRMTVTSPSRQALLTMAALKRHERTLERRFNTTVAIQATKPKRDANGLFRQQVALYGRVIVREMYVEEEETSKRIQDLRRALTGQLQGRDRTLSRPVIDRQLVVARLDGVRRVKPQRGLTAGMEEITTVDQLLARFPRLLVPGPHAPDQQSARDDLAQYYHILFEEPHVQRSGWTVPVTAQLLHELEHAEADLARHLPYFPQPPVTSIGLLYAPLYRHLVDVRNDYYATITPGRGLALELAKRRRARPWLAMAPYLLRHELGEAVQDVEIGWWDASSEKVSTRRDALDLRAKLTIEGYPEARYLQHMPRLMVSEFSADRQRAIKALLAPEKGHRVWDLVADLVAFRMVEDQPRVHKKMLAAWRAYYRANDEKLRLWNQWDPGSSTDFFGNSLIDTMGSVTVTQAIAETLGEVTIARDMGQVATNLVALYEHDPSRHDRGVWPAAYRTVIEYYRAIAHDLQLRTPDAGMEEDPIEAALRRGPVTFTVGPDGTVAMKTPAGPVTVEIPSDLLASGFFRPGAEVVMVPVPAQPPTWSGIRLVDQVGLSRRPDGVADYLDWRSVTKAKQFIGWLRTLPRWIGTTAVLYRPRLIAPSQVQQWFHDKLMIEVETSVYPTVAQSRLLVSAAAANGRALSVDDLLQRFSYRGQEVLLIAA